MKRCDLTEPLTRPVLDVNYRWNQTRNDSAGFSITHLTFMIVMVHSNAQRSAERG